MDSRLIHRLALRTLVAAAFVASALLSASLFSSAATAQAGPQRVVVIGGSLTEIVYELGVEDRVIAVDITSVWPVEAMQRHGNVGYMRALSAEIILALSPDAVIALSGSGPPTTFEVLEDAGVPVTVVPEGYTPEAIHEKIRIVAETFGVAEAGAALADRVAEETAAVAAAIAAAEPAPRKILFVFSFASGRIIAAGADTAADAIIRLAGGVNAMTGFSGYVPVSDEAVVAAAPDVVMAMENAGPETVTAAVFGLPALAATPAGANQSFVSFDGQYILAFGPRTPSAIRDLAIAIYPELQPLLATEGP